MIVIAVVFAVLLVCLAKKNRDNIPEAPPMRLRFKPERPVPTMSKRDVAERLLLYAEASDYLPLQELEKALEIPPYILDEYGEFLFIAEADENGRLEPHIRAKHNPDHVIGYWSRQETNQENGKAIAFFYGPGFCRAVGLTRPQE